MLWSFRRIAILLVAASAALASTACRHHPETSASPTAADSSRLIADVRWLASDAREGRGTGTAGNDSAAAYIAQRFAALRLTPIVRPENCGASCRPRFVQPFVARSALASAAGPSGALPTSNVVAMITGHDPARRGQIVVLGAHFDHLGRSAFNAMDADKPNEIRNGADDNASGVATILELARLLKAAPPARSVAVVAFSGEELGLLGSAWFVDHAPFALDSVQAMLNFDMVGRLRNDKLIVYGTASATELSALVNDANVAPPFQLVAVGDGTGPSDHSSFYLRRLPVLHFFTDLHDDYHRASDDADRIDAGGMARVTAFAERVTRAIADRPARLTYVNAPVASSMMGSSSRTGVQAYLGTVPDMSSPDTKGLRLSGVRPGSPAELGGLIAGDIIVELGGAEVSDLNSYSAALYSHAPGDEVSIVVMRNNARQTVKVTLGKRGT